MIELAVRYTKQCLRKSMSCSVFHVAGFAIALLVVVISICRPAELSAEPAYDGHHDLSYYLGSDGVRAPIRTESDWQIRRRHILNGIQEAMGPLPRPAAPVPLSVQILEEHTADGIIRRKLAFHTDSHDDRIYAWILIPENAQDLPTHPLPAMLCLHQTTPNGKDSPVGLSDRPTMHYALELARREYVTLAPDYPSLGEYDHDFECDDYASGSMKAIYDNIRAVDLLTSLPDVDPSRIGCIGHSLGGHNAIFTAVFDERIRAVVTSCGFTSFHKYKGGDLRGWSGPRYMPRIAARYNFSPDRMPFDFPELIAALAPRSVFIVAPIHDDNFDVDGVRDCVQAAAPIYRMFCRSDRLQVLYENGGHDFSDNARQAAYQFLDRALKKPN